MWVGVLLMPAVAIGQGRQVSPDTRELERAAALGVRGATSDVLAGPVVTDAPFSADAATTVTQVLGDGTRIEQTTSAKFFRDRAGRVRREQTILGLGALSVGGNLQTITIDPDPGDGTAYTLDPSTRTARRVPRLDIALSAGMMMTYSGSLAAVRVQSRTPGTGGRGVGSSPTEESLGTRQFEGVKAVGRKTTSIIPVGQIGNDRAIEITDERWESPELRMLIYSRNSDPRTGVVEYKLTNINRSEPPADLFAIPSDYTVNQPLALPPGTPGMRGGGRGGRAGGAVPPGSASPGRNSTFLPDVGPNP
jgi:hypothetical protein